MERQNVLEKSRVLHQLMQRATLDAIEIEYTAQRLQAFFADNICIAA